jgi:pseudouridine synthase
MKKRRLIRVRPQTGTGPKARPRPGAPPRRPPAEDGGDGRVRINRFLASAGLCSRRAADGYVKGGRVSINGKVVREVGVRIDPTSDEVRVDGVVLEREKPVYVLFNKPKGVICTSARQEHRKRVIDYLPHVRGRVYTVGRLDAESEGLILLTNDGDFALRMMHPRYGVPKTYAVLIRGALTKEGLEKARGGVWLSEGKTGAFRMQIEHKDRDKTYLKVTIREGKNREVRRVFAKIGHTVLTLKRVRIGGLSLHGLSEGESRFLSRHEVDGLLAGARIEPKEESEG